MSGFNPHGYDRSGPSDPNDPNRRPNYHNHYIPTTQQQQQSLPYPSGFNTPSTSTGPQYPSTPGLAPASLPPPSSNRNQNAPFIDHTAYHMPPSTYGDPHLTLPPVTARRPRTIRRPKTTKRPTKKAAPAPQAPGQSELKPANCCEKATAGQGVCSGYDLNGYCRTCITNQTSTACIRVKECDGGNPATMCDNCVGRRFLEQERRIDEKYAVDIEVGASRSQDPSLSRDRRAKERKRYGDALQARSAETQGARLFWGVDENGKRCDLPQRQKR